MTIENTNLGRLEKILDEFSEAIVICDLWGWIHLFNPQARELFGGTKALNTGHSLYTICNSLPFEQAFSLLLRKSKTTSRLGNKVEANFICATVKETTLLNCHARLVPADASHESVFVLSFRPLEQRIDETTLKGSVLTRMIEDLRGPMANINAAVESLRHDPEIEQEKRLEFERVIGVESADLIRRYEAVVQESRSLTYTQWPLIDVHSSDLIACVINKLKEQHGLLAAMTGIPQWLHGDSHSLKLTLENLALLVAEASGVSALDIDVQQVKQRVYIDIVWQGLPIPQATVESWLEKVLQISSTEMTVSDVLERHNSDMWCMPHRKKGYSLLRIPALASQREWQTDAAQRPPRPEFYSSQFWEVEIPTILADQPLSSLNGVVFDVETTGLAPEGGDAIIALAGVRISEGRILGGQCFRSLINPNRPIPVSSINFHNITNDAVRGKPPIGVVLPEFRQFVGDDILIGHNVAFDMAFIRQSEEKASVMFNNPVLDTLLLSVIADEDESDHSLDAACGRLGIRTCGRYSAIGDCLITAQLFLDLIDILADRGITTIGQAIAVSKKVAADRNKLAGR